MAATTRQIDEEADTRSAYPLYGLKKALQIAGVVAELGGAKAAVSKSLIARHLSMDEAAAALSQTIGAAKAFGFIEGRGAYRLSEIGLHYFYPTTDTEKHHALLAALKMPTVFEALIDRFDGSRVPTTEVLTNILHRDHKVTESWRPRLASLFLTSLRDAEVIDGAGFLRYRASMDGTTGSNIRPMNTAVQPVPDFPQVVSPPTSPTQVRNDDVGAVSVNHASRTTWNHKGLRVETPDPLPMDLWQKLSNYVNVLKPGDNEK
jgi:hypothetical protein